MLGFVFFPSSKYSICFRDSFDVFQWSFNDFNINLGHLFFYSCLISLRAQNLESDEYTACELIEQ